jgi:hypothetical protein
MIAVQVFPFFFFSFFQYQLIMHFLFPGQVAKLIGTSYGSLVTNLQLL